MAKQKKGNLYLIPTPLSDNSTDAGATTRITETILGIQHFLVENVRTARRFISSLKLNVLIESLHIALLDKDTPKEEIDQLCAPLLQGKDMGVMSEAGCPGIADPGHLAVIFAHEHGGRVIPLIGPSSVTLALMASGFNGQSFVFHGYLPIDGNARIQAIKTLEKDAVSKNQTQIFIETPYRNNQLLLDIIKNCNPATRLCVASDLTGPEELIKSQSIREWAGKTVNLHKIPAVFLIYA
ncbi:MAG: SAM-dependent methyltransferase [Cyclobacteriaceae bacterium]|nr:SAM-dependent methyltransferase [Cyclobacteriaceae bacterium]